MSRASSLIWVEFNLWNFKAPQQEKKHNAQQHTTKNTSLLWRHFNSEKIPHQYKHLIKLTTENLSIERQKNINYIDNSKTWSRNTVSNNQHELRIVCVCVCVCNVICYRDTRLQHPITVSMETGPVIWHVTQYLDHFVSSVRAVCVCVCVCVCVWRGCKLPLWGMISV